MRLSALAERLALPFEGDADPELTGVAALDAAGPDHLSFVTSSRWRAALAKSAAGAVLAAPGVDCGTRPVLRSARPRRDFARAVALLRPRVRPAPGIHPTAAVDAGANVSPDAAVGARAVVGPGCVVGAGTAVHANATLYPDVEVGVDCEIHAGCVLREGTRVGDRVILQPGVILGGDGFGYEPGEDGEWEKIPQVGIVVVGDDVEIGAGTTIDRASLGETRIGRGVKIDNLVQIGHNCVLGEDALIVAQSGLGGSTRLGRRAVMMGRTASAGQLSIGDGAFVGASASVVRDLAAGGRAFGTPAVEGHTWHRAMAALWRLPEAMRRLRRLEKRVDTLDSEDRDA
jgi:UDP-3-O-[3-hydroxymyristoyl] glucosamine N-acyltransferase